MPQTQLPTVSLELVRWLEATFPDRCPDQSDPERDIWMAVGAARVVRKLRALHEQQVRTSIGG